MKQEYKVGDYITEIGGLPNTCKIINICPEEVWGHWYNTKNHKLFREGKLLYDTPQNVRPATQEEIRIYKEEAEPQIVLEAL